VTGSVYALILAGGGGTRLWPASRRQRPKQFLPLLPNGRTLLGATVERLAAVAPPEHTLIVTAANQLSDVERTAPTVPRSNIVLEPEARNTAACIGLGALEALRRDPDAVIAVVPSDQYAVRADAYCAVLERALEVARRGVIATVGIQPTGPETGFGYIEVGEPLPELASVEGSVRAVRRFVEKPDRLTAERYVASRSYLWNSGMFFFQAKRLLAAIEAHLPELGSVLAGIRQDPKRTGELYPTAPPVSIDYGVMEKLAPGELCVVPGDFGWSDVGLWSALPSVIPPDSKGNVPVGDTVVVDASGNVLYSESGKLIAVVGVRDLVVVSAGDAVLVLPKSRAQDVKEIIRALESSKRESYL
jgi:mannose-1-phosphate guanylyltransferase